VEYDPCCWYFEALECVRRLLLTSVLPLPSMRSESLGQIVLILLVSLAFAGLYAHLRPFVSYSMDTFANVMQTILFLNFFLTLILFAEAHICEAEYKSNMVGAGFGIFFMSLVVAPLSGFGSLIMEIVTNYKNDYKNDFQSKSEDANAVGEALDGAKGRFGVLLGRAKKLAGTSFRRARARVAPAAVAEEPNTAEADDPPKAPPPYEFRDGAF